MRLNDLVEDRKLTQTRVAEIFGIRQPRVTKHRSFKHSRFSSQRLLDFITLLNKRQPHAVRPCVPAE